jgi:hypothetical protein
MLPRASCVFDDAVSLLEARWRVDNNQCTSGAGMSTITQCVVSAGDGGRRGIFDVKPTPSAGRIRGSWIGSVVLKNYMRDYGAVRPSNSCKNMAWLARLHPDGNLLKRPLLFSWRGIQHDTVPRGTMRHCPYQRPSHRKKNNPAPSCTHDQKHPQPSLQALQQQQQKHRKALSSFEG